MKISSMPLNRQQRIMLSGWLFFLSFFIQTNAQNNNAPQATKVEPPSWWLGSTVNPVRLLIRGKNLSGARVESRGAGLSISATRTNEAGTYLFADVSLDPKTAPGRHTLTITTAQGSTQAAFEILPALERTGKFQGFSPDDLIYLIMPDRFADGDTKNNEPPESRGLYDRRRKRYYHGGDFQGIIEHLPYLKDLGVTALWINPWYDNYNGLNEKEFYDEGPITDYHGYGAVDLYGVEEHFGNHALLRRLVEQAHRQGIKIIQDQVDNHTSPYHPWVKDSPTPTWYNGTEAKHLANTFLPWTLQDPYGKNQSQKATLEGWFIDILPDFNQNDPETARYLIQNTLWWIGTTGLDAVRQDTLPYVPRTFWHDWSAAIKREFPQVNVVGELYDGDPGLVSFFQGGRVRADGIDSGIDSLFDFPLLYGIRHAFAEGKSIREIPQLIAHDHLYVNPNILVTFLGNHDMPRFMNEPNANTKGLRLAQTLVLTMRGVPQIYYGDEIAMQGGGDPDNRRDFPGGFPLDARNAFTREGRTYDEQVVFEHVQKLARLRRELEPLRRGTLANLYLSDQQYAYARTTSRESVLIVFNNDAKAATIDVPLEGTKFPDGAQLVDHLVMNRFGDMVKDTQVAGGHVKIEMPARTAAILTIR